MIPVPKIWNWNQQPYQYKNSEPTGICNTSWVSDNPLENIISKFIVAHKWTQLSMQNIKNK